MSVSRDRVRQYHVTLTRPRDETQPRDMTQPPLTQPRDISYPHILSRQQVWGDVHDPGTLSEQTCRIKKPQGFVGGATQCYTVC